MGPSKRFSSSPVEDEFEYDEGCFRTFYTPLSNLPTPPPSSRDSSMPPQSPQLSVEDSNSLNSEFLGAAAHMARMLPPGVSFNTPSVSITQDILTRANLPMEIVALAVCILDSLNSKFSVNWRVSFPVSSVAPAQKRHTLPSGGVARPPEHIDSIHPEVVILAALMIASKFIEDTQDPTYYFMTYWAQDRWSCAQINFTERCIMESLNYRIMPLWEPIYIKEARHDMEMARRELVRCEEKKAEREGTGAISAVGKHGKSKSSGHAVVGFGHQWTPGKSPNSDVSTPHAGCVDKIERETLEAFSTPKPLPANYLRFPTDLQEKS